MEPSNTPDYSGSTTGTTSTKSNLLMICDPLCRVTTFSKILAAVLFISLPFIGAYVGYRVAEEKVEGIPIAQQNENNFIPAEARVVMPDQALQFDIGFGATSSMYSIKNGNLYFQRKNGELQELQKNIERATAYNPDIVHANDMLWFENTSKEKTVIFRSLTPGVFLSDSNIYKRTYNDQPLELMFANVAGRQIASKIEVSNILSDTKITGPLADGGYSVSVFTDGAFTYCTRPPDEVTQKALIEPVSVIFNPVSEVEYADKNQVEVNGHVHSLWNTDQKNTIGYLTLKETTTGKLYSFNCEEIPAI